MGCERLIRRNPQAGRDATCADRLPDAERTFEQDHLSRLELRAECPTEFERLLLAKRIDVAPAA